LTCSKILFLRLFASTLVLLENETKRRQNTESRFIFQWNSIGKLAKHVNVRQNKTITVVKIFNVDHTQQIGLILLQQTRNHNSTS